MNQQMTENLIQAMEQLTSVLQECSKAIQSTKTDDTVESNSDISTGSVEGFSESDKHLQIAKVDSLISNLKESYEAVVPESKSNRPSNIHEKIVHAKCRLHDLGINIPKELNHSPQDETEAKQVFQELVRLVIFNSTLVGKKVEIDGLISNEKLSTMCPLSKQEYRNKTTTEAVEEMVQKGMLVEVKEYQHKEAAKALKEFKGTPKEISPGSQVTVYEEKGRVLFYTACSSKQSWDAQDDPTIKRKTG